MNENMILCVSTDLFLCVCVWCGEDKIIITAKCPIIIMSTKSLSHLSLNLLINMMKQQHKRIFL